MSLQKKKTCVLLQLQQIIICIILFSPKCIFICSLLFCCFLGLSLYYYLNFSMASLKCLFTPGWLCVQQQVCVSFLALGEKVMRDDEFTCDLFRFLQLLCEGHNSGECLLDDSSFNILNHSLEITQTT